MKINKKLENYHTGTWDVEYNGENRPIKWTNNATNESIVMYYDYRGRRCGKLFYNSDGIWQSSVKFFYNNFTLIQESTAANIITKEFVWDPSEPVATRPLAMKCNVQNLNLLYTHDANKNVTEVFFKNPENGLAAHYEYSPFGELIISTKDTPITEIDIRNFNPFRFSSEYHDDELNLIYYNYRHYDPATGRFLSRDPIAEQGGTNLYNFTANNPINVLDILGNAWWSWIPILGNIIDAIIDHKGTKISDYSYSMNCTRDECSHNKLDIARCINSINSQFVNYLKDFAYNSATALGIDAVLVFGSLSIGMVSNPIGFVIGGIITIDGIFKVVNSLNIVNKIHEAATQAKNNFCNCLEN